MSLNKHDLTTFRRAKRQRAQKIDLLIILLFVLLAIFVTLDHPPPRPGAPAFHKAEAKQTERGNVSPPPVVARAPH
jgi:hypothetical protein